MTGRGRLGVSGNTLALTEGSYDAALGVLATAGPDTRRLGHGCGWRRWVAEHADRPDHQSHRLPGAALVPGHAPARWASPSLQLQRQWRCTPAAPASARRVLVAAAPGGLAPAHRLWLARPAPGGAKRALPQVTNGLPETVLAENASPQARPRLVAGPNGRMALVWNSVSGSGAADAVSLRLFDGSTWGSVVTVSQPAVPPSRPAPPSPPTATCGSPGSEAQVAPDPAGLTAAFARSLEIAWAEVNPATGQVVRRGLVTSDDVLDFAPRLSAARDGTVWLAWQHSPGTNLAGTAASPNHFKAATWTGAGWTAIETAGQNGVGILFWDIAAVDAAGSGWSPTGTATATSPRPTTVKSTSTRAPPPGGLRPTG